MRALIDTCVILDVLEKRESFFVDSLEVFNASANYNIYGFITAKSVTDIYYVLNKYLKDIKVTKAAILKLFKIFNILDTTGIDCQKAIISTNTNDFEDAVMIETAIRSEMDCIITRNEHDYRKAEIKVITPKQFVEAMSDKH